MRSYRAIGLMSGTSLDGVDVALVETDGETISTLGPDGYRPYSEHEREVLRRALQAAAGLARRDERSGVLGEAQALVTRCHIEAVETFARAHALSFAAIDVIGFHGQTVLHRPQAGLTVQIGDGMALARRFKTRVVHDFRAADVAAGGQGAPLVPIYHCALVAQLKVPRPVAVLNIGGVANVTYCDDGTEPIACDTGPGNALIDDFMRARAGRALDDGGRTAALGEADDKFINRVLADPFFAAAPPKSLDRNAFSLAGLTPPHWSIADGAATLAALTAAAVERAVAHLPRPPASWIVAGGGARNRTLTGLLTQKLAPAAVATADALGLSSAALEAQAFAYLAVRSLRGLALTFPTTTGVPRPMTGGVTAAPA